MDRQKLEYSQKKKKMWEWKKKGETHNYICNKYVDTDETNIYMPVSGCCVSINYAKSFQQYEAYRRMWHKLNILTRALVACT